MGSVLVTGGAGFIGSHTCKALAADGFTPAAFDNLSRGHSEFVRWGPLAVGDILNSTELDEAFKRYRPDAVIHFAALAYVGESFPEALAYYRINVSGMANLLDAMVRNGVTKIILSSSCATYGVPDEVPITETAPQRPISPYGHSKLICEQMLRDVASSNGLRFVIFRYFNAGGADKSGTLPERHNPETHLIPLAIDAATGNGPPLQIFGADYATSDGTCERDFIHVSDLAMAHVNALRYLHADNGSLEANLGSGRAHSVLQVKSAIERVTGIAVPVIWAPRRSGDPPTLYANTALAQRVLRFAPQSSDLDTIIETAWRSRGLPAGSASELTEPSHVV
jgi:UDP-arabinose 4-epimerase